MATGNGPAVHGNGSVHVERSRPIGPGLRKHAPVTGNAAARRAGEPAGYAVLGLVVPLLFTAAADGDPATGKAVLVGVGIVWLAACAVGCTFWPFTRCGKCKGLGKFRSPGGKAWRKCRRCKGYGERLRIGRRLWNWANARKRNGARRGSR